MIKVVDFTNFEKNKEKIAEELGETWSSIGFLAAKNHGVDQELIKKAYDKMKSFFYLTQEEKMKYYKPEVKGQRGFVPNGMETAVGAKVADFKEFIHFGPENDFNLFKNVWPKEIENLKETMQELYKQMHSFSEKILTATAIYLKLKDIETFHKMFENGGETIIRSLYYPATKDIIPKGSVRSAAHTDLNFITLLPNASGKGLEVQDRDNNWHSVPSLPDYIICNCADMMQNMSNYKLLSTIHRVINPEDNNNERFSMPFFITPNLKSSISPLKELGEPDPRAEFITAEQFLKNRVESIIKK